MQELCAFKLQGGCVCIWIYINICDSQFKFYLELLVKMVLLLPWVKCQININCAGWLCLVQLPCDSHHTQACRALLQCTGGSAALALWWHSREPLEKGILLITDCQSSIIASLICIWFAFILPPEIQHCKREIVFCPCELPSFGFLSFRQVSFFVWLFFF